MTIFPSTSRESITSIVDQSSQSLSTPSPGSNLSTVSIVATASILPTSILSDPGNSHVPTLFTTLPTASSGRPTLTFPLSPSMSTNSRIMHLTKTTTPLTSTLPSVLYSPTISPIPTNILSDHSSISNFSGLPSSTQHSPSSSSHTTSASSSLAMTPNNRVGLIIAILGLVALLFAAIIVLFLRQKQRKYLRSLIQKSREKEKERDREKKR